MLRPDLLEVLHDEIKLKARQRLTRAILQIILLALYPLLQSLSFPACSLDALLHRLWRHVVGHCDVEMEQWIGFLSLDVVRLRLGRGRRFEAPLFGSCWQCCERADNAGNDVAQGRRVVDSDVDVW